MAITATVLYPTEAAGLEHEEAFPAISRCSLDTLLRFAGRVASTSSRCLATALSGEPSLRLAGEAKVRSCCLWRSDIFEHSQSPDLPPWIHYSPPFFFFGWGNVLRQLSAAR
jgi:hypothetical protein